MRKNAVGKLRNAVLKRKCLNDYIVAIGHVV